MTQCKRIAIEPSDAKAAKTLICPTFFISFGHWIELNKKPTKEEEVFLYQLGGVAQYLDDLFDVREDFLEGRQTLANPIVAVDNKKKSFKKEVLLFLDSNVHDSAIYQIIKFPKDRFRL